MPGMNVLFVCPNNTFFGPLAEAVLNAEACGMVRAFSAGVSAGAHLHPYVQRYLKSANLNHGSLSPKSVDVFLLPHAPMPDKVIYLAGAKSLEFPAEWQGAVQVETWELGARGSVFPEMNARAFREIRNNVLSLLHKHQDAVVFKYAS